MPPHPALEVFRAFLRLGLTSFGGPIAHLGYFRREFVERRRWLDEAQFAQLLAISQFLPGPASSQLGFAIGLVRAGWMGAIGAFVAFTLPSALLLFALAAAGAWTATPVGQGITQGLKLAAVAVVAHGVVRMARQMTPDAVRIVIAVAVLAGMLLVDAPWMQLAVIAAGAVAGALAVHGIPQDEGARFTLRYGPSGAAVAALLFVVGLAAALTWPSTLPSLASLGAAFWQAGSLVFGGGHVVLPLIERSVVSPGWVSADVFLAGYGAAQAIPGPMFSLAAFLGAQVPTGAPAALGALVATLAVFVPGFLLVVAILPAWTRLTQLPRALNAVAGVNAAVVGLLAAALIDPVITTAVKHPRDVVIAVVALALLWDGKRSALWSVGWCVAASAASALFIR